MLIEDIEDILDEFDFEKVKKVMDALEWTYFDSPDSKITISELRKMARHLLTIAYNEEPVEYMFTASGGFQVGRWMFPGDTKKYLTLKFVVAEWTNAD